MGLDSRRVGGWRRAGLRTTGVAPGWRPEGWRHGCRPLGDHQEGTDSQLQARASLRSAPDGWPVGTREAAIAVSLIALLRLTRAPFQRADSALRERGQCSDLPEEAGHVDEFPFLRDPSALA